MDIFLARVCLHCLLGNTVAVPAELAAIAILLSSVGMEVTQLLHCYSINSPDLIRDELVLMSS